MKSLGPKVNDSNLLRDVLCFSHLRWTSVFERPQQLMMRFARTRRVFFVEEPVCDAAIPQLDVRVSHGVHVVVPHLARGTSAAAALEAQRGLVTELVETRRINAPLLWFYTPLALPIVGGLACEGVVYDCIDGLQGVAAAAPELPQREDELLARADLVFTGGLSLFDAKRGRHPRVHPFPSCADVPHFRRARRIGVQPIDQQPIARPRLGCSGVIDERIDLELIRDLAASHPEWQLILIGPVAKIDPAALPRAANIHYLGMKKYEQLPAYLAGWDVALLPFARNDATRFISPTTAPEYLAAGLPVVSTSLKDVVRPYGERGLVHIADTADEFARAIPSAWSSTGSHWLRDVDALLAATSWDRTWSAMSELVAATLAERRDGPAARRAPIPEPAPAQVAVRRSAATA